MADEAPIAVRVAGWTDPGDGDGGEGRRPSTRDATLSCRWLLGPVRRHVHRHRLVLRRWAGVGGRG